MEKKGYKDFMEPKRSVVGRFYAAQDSNNEGNLLALCHEVVNDLKGG